MCNMLEYLVIFILQANHFFSTPPFKARVVHGLEWEKMENFGKLSSTKVNHTDAVVSFEIFRALKLTLFESLRVLKSYNPI